MMHIKTYTKWILWVIVFLFGTFSPYSFFHYNGLSNVSEHELTSAPATNSASVEHTTEPTADNHTNSRTSEDNNFPSQQTRKPQLITVEFHELIASAAGEQTSTNADLAATLEWFLKVVYVLLWPLLWIAWLAMDNSLVYGEMFGLDTALFKFWSIMKNFANFALGFMFVRSIVSYVINPNEKKNPKDMITKLLVAGVGVQLSWFIIGALVDLSTVLTVGIWGLPLQLIGDTNVANQPVFAVKTAVRLNDKIGSDNNLVVLYTRPWSSLPADKYLLPCYFKDQKVDFGTGWRTAFGVMDWGDTITGTNNVKRNNIEPNYCIAGNNVLSKTVYESKWSPQFVWGDPTTKDVINESLTAFVWNYCANNIACQTMSTFAKSSEGYQWAFYSLYASLLGLSTIHIGVPKSDVSMVMETLIKTLVWLAYLIPLAILCVVLVMRVGYLWLIIAFSPFIILGSVDKLGIKALEGGLKLGDKLKFNLTNVISLLLLPVVVTFTMCLSIVFLSSLSEWLSTQGSSESLGIYQRTEWNYKCYDIAVTDICIDMPSQDIGTGIFDYFSWFILNIFGVGLMWFVVMAALKSSELTAWVASSVQKLSESMLSSAPIIPIPGSGGKSTSLGSISGLGRDLQWRLDSQQSNNQQALTSVITGVVDDVAGKGKVWGEKMASLESTITATGPAGVSQASNALKTILQEKTIWTNELDFGQYNNSTSFANKLATHGWEDKNTPAPSFSNGQELFTTQGGQQLLASLLDKTWGETSDLRKLYSGKSDPATSNQWAVYEDKINALRKGSGIAPTSSTNTPVPTGSTPTQGNTPVLHTPANKNTAKTQFGVDKDSLYSVKAWEKRVNKTLVWSLDSASLQDETTWKNIATTLNTFEPADIKALGLEKTIQNLINKPITPKDWPAGIKYNIILNPTTKAYERKQIP